MKAALATSGLAAFGALAALAGCVRASEGMVREQAAAAFRCADYALQVEEVAPEVYRASGCGQELIYACHAAAPPRRAPARASLPSPEGETAEEVADVGDDAVMVCARRPR
jgi:hypothetical protein